MLPSHSLQIRIKITLISPTQHDISVSYPCGAPPRTLQSLHSFCTLSWSPSEPMWTNSPQRSYFGRYSSHEPWRSPVLLLPALPVATTPTKVKENRYSRKQQRQKRNPSNSFSSPSMPKTNLHARQHGSPAQSPFEIHCQMLNGGLSAALLALLRRSDPSGSLGRLVSPSVHQLIGLGISASEMEENPSQFNRSSTSLVQ